MSPADSEAERRAHWQRVYRDTAADAVSWFQPEARQSLAMIEACGLGADDPIIDVGGGASNLVDGLLARGHRAVTVLDLSEAALDVARARLGADAARVQWIAADVTDVVLPAAAHALWHDRAVFHFLTEPAQREAYRRQLRHALRPGGAVVIATFADDGPPRCSGLPVMRYTPESLLAELGPGFELVDSSRETHTTPRGSEQRFVWLHARRTD